MGVAAVALAPAVHRLSEQARVTEDAGVFGEEAEHQARHEVVHVAAPVVLGPRRVLAQQLDVKLVQPPRGAHVDGVVLDLLDRGDARQRQQEAEVVGEVFKGACDGLAAGQLLSFQRLPIGGQHELGLALGGGSARQ